MNRRETLKSLALATCGLGASAQARTPAASAPPWKDAVLRYLRSLARPDGGYAHTDDQEHSHLSAAFAVIACHQVLDEPLRDVDKLSAFIRSHHPRELKKLEQEHRVFDFQQIQSLIWLKQDVSAFHATVTAWKKPVAYIRNYERGGNPVLQYELAAIRCRELLKIPVEDEVRATYMDYLAERRRPDGSFNNTPVGEGGGGHVINTWWALRALQAMGVNQLKTDHRLSLIAWLRDCQRSGGGFTHAPNPEFATREDVACTWAAVRALHLLGSKPAHPAACITWLQSLAGEDGGFADQPGWLSNPMATYQALDSLDLLGALNKLDTDAPPARPRPAVSIPADLKVYTIQIEAHGKGSPAETVDLARSLRIHLWGAKNSEPGWIARAQALADQQGVPVKFFVADEEYGTWVTVPGLGTYSHTSDIIAPAGADIGPSLAEAGAVSWPDYRTRRLDPLQKGQGRLVWQFGENEELVRLFLNDSVERGGFSAISTFHFGNPDFTNSEPFLHRWRGQLPYVALLDAHGPESWWWSDVLTGCRTLFLAAEPTWEGWLNALKNNWVAAARHDVHSGGQTWLHTGSTQVREFITARELEWRWWDNPAIRRPLASIVHLRPGDAFEAGVPESGHAIRIRCAWQCTPQSALKQPVTDLVQFLLDGKAVPTTLVTKQSTKGKALLDDEYHHVLLPDITPGTHLATAHLRMVETQKELKRRVKIVIE